MAEQFVRAARLEDVIANGCTVVTVEGHTVALFSSDGKVFAIDNRCPHMGFPLHRGTLKEGILTCHWHHARFDLASGGTFDLFADDVRAFPVVIRGDEVWIDVALRRDHSAHQRGRLREGLENDIPLVIAKAVIALEDKEGGMTEAFRVGLNFGTRYRKKGWSVGLTKLACMMNLLPQLDPQDRPRALYHGLSAVAWDTESEPARFVVRPLPTSTTDVGVLKRWFRQFIEVRDREGAERCVTSAIHAGADSNAMADMLFAAATDHRYIRSGHTVDFINKAFEALDVAGWEYAEQTLTSLVGGMAEAERMEESNSWRHPVDLVLILQNAFERLPKALESGRSAPGAWSWNERHVDVLLGEDPWAVAEALLDALSDGATGEQIAGLVAYAAALRIAQYHTSNEFSDWNTALHTFSFANAVHQGLRRVSSPELLRGAFDAAMSVYLDRYLNIPATRLPVPTDEHIDPDALLRQFPDLLDEQQQVNRAADLVARYLYGHGNPDFLIAMLCKLLLREDRDFHTMQTVEGCVRQFRLLQGSAIAVNVLIAAARYLAAHSPTMRAQGQTYQIALRLSRGERLYQEG